MNHKSKAVSVVTIEAGGEPQEVTIDAEKYWDNFRQKHRAAQYAAMREIFFWQVMSPHFGLPTDQWQTFLKSYLTGRPKREELLLGGRNKNRVEAHFLYQAALGIYLTEHPLNLFEDLSKPSRSSLPTYYYFDEDSRQWRNEELGTAISKLVGEGDFRTIEKLAAIVKEESGSDKTDYEKWNELEASHPREDKPFPLEGESAHMTRWRIFCNYVIENCSLPTKAELTTLWGLTSKNKKGHTILKHKEANDFRKMIGLGGLPQKT